MPISPHLLRKLQEALGAEAAGDLASHIEDMDSNRRDIGELRHEMQLGFARIDARFDRGDEQFKRVDDQFKRVDEQFSRVYGRFTGVDTQLAQVQSDLVKLIENGQTKMELLLEKALREQTRFFFLAWAVLLATIVGIYAR